MMMVLKNKEEQSMFFAGDVVAPDASGVVATHQLYSIQIIIKGHDCLSYLSMKDLTKLFCIKNEIDLECRGSLS